MLAPLVPGALPVTIASVEVIPEILGTAIVFGAAAGIVAERVWLGELPS